MRQYVNFQDDRAKIPLLVEQIDSFEYIVVDNEHESLVLEKNLINQHSPFFNADFKDDKSYPFIALTKGDVFPAIKYTRESIDRTRAISARTPTAARRDMVDIARRVVPLCACSCADWRQMKRRLDKDPLALLGAEARPCFDAHVGLGPGACCGRVTPEEYADNVKRITRFLSGHHREFIEELTSEMQQAAADLDFERAGRVKARIDTINSLTDKQHAVSCAISTPTSSASIARKPSRASMFSWCARDALSTRTSLCSTADPMSPIRIFCTTSSCAITTRPRRSLMRLSCARTLDDVEVMQEWLTGKLNSPHGARCGSSNRVRGEKAELVDMAETNAKHTLMRHKVRTNYDDKRINDALMQLESALALDGPPMRIECFDISTIHGSYTVASMVVFTGGKPDKNQYRRFKIKTPLDEANDFLSMQEVMSRRYAPRAHGG